ncbi:MAG: hypothetical protein KGJ62_02710 [Armatimonadetes bacterium]|nr:hypothetical protein [Armatimonadota bacterium]MDE2205642.1 hypothetical protein [Armatimonadota bacterium]
MSKDLLRLAWRAARTVLPLPVAVLGLWLAAGTACRAQAPIVFDNLDWTVDRGATTMVGLLVAPNANLLRQGRNITAATAPVGNGLNPGPSVRRWVFPRTSDIALTAANGNPVGNEIIDNPNLADPIFTGITQQPLGDNSQDTTGAETRVQPFPPLNAAGSPVGEDPQQMAHAFWLPNLATWTPTGFNLPFGATNDYRAPGGGFSFNSDPSLSWDFDYGYVPAIHDDFNVNRPDGADGPATADELAALPNAPYYVYNAVNSTLNASALNGAGTPTAVWSAGQYNLASGRYAVALYSPGDGSLVGTTPSPEVSRAFVRVAWINTINANGSLNWGTGTPGAGGITDPDNSRIFEVNLSAGGWITLQGGGLGPAAFDQNNAATASNANQIVVVLYSLTPDQLNDPIYGGPTNAIPPVVTADACRFSPVAASGTTPPAQLTKYNTATPPAALWTISPAGRILGPEVATDKIKVAAGIVQPLHFVAREEDVPNTTDLSAVNPTLPISATNIATPDPTAEATAPVFYCLDSRNSVGPANDLTDPNYFSVSRVVWRYVGLPDGASGTASASPTLANVRCRDGVTRPMVYFVTTNSGGALGHIYAIDPLPADIAAGNLALTPTVYWAYPSAIPLTAAETAASDITQLHDPNYTGSTPFVGYAATFGGDVAIPYFDGDIITDRATGTQQVRSDTAITFGGVQAAPALMSSPDPSIKGNVLVVPDMDGRVWAFDAGGRGDWGTAGVSYPGTTQRLWTWPHFGVDAFRQAIKPANWASVPNKFADEASLGPFLSSPAVDRTYPLPIGTTLVPFIVGSSDGHLYSVVPALDALTAVGNGTASWNNRILWRYPSANNTLGSPVSTPAIFKPTNATSAYIYFTAGGRAYCVPEAPDIRIKPPTVNSLSWVFPYTPNPPAPNPKDDTTASLDPGFNLSAPLLMEAGVNGNQYDACYLLQGNGTVIGLDAAPVATGVAAGHALVVASGQSLTGSFSESSPIGTWLTSSPGLGANPNVPTMNTPTMLFGDDDGNIWGLSTVPLAGSIGPVGNGAKTAPLLPVDYYHSDSSASRTGEAVQVGGDNQPESASYPVPNGMLAEGDQGGQLRGYGVGTDLTGGAAGFGNTVGKSEPAENSIGGNGPVSIDLRILDFYDPAVWQHFMGLTAPYETPGRTPAGASFANTQLPITGNIEAGSTAIAVDWGDYLYIAAWGVYHAQPSSLTPGQQVAAPVVICHFTITQPGRSIAPQITVPAMTLHTGLNWPDDPGITLAEHNNLAIFGQNASGSVGQLVGEANNVFPWVAIYKVPIRPAGLATFLPGLANYRVTAQAFIQQSTQTNGIYRAQSNILQDGQPDLVGLSKSAYPQNQNLSITANSPRKVFITNPIGVTVRSYSPLQANGDLTPMMDGQNGLTDPDTGAIGWGAAAGVLASPGIFEVLGNGNEIINPLSPTAAGSSAGGATLKSLFAPIGMVQDGSSGQYSGIDPTTGNAVPAFFVLDRSNIRAMTGRPLLIRIQPSTDPNATLTGGPLHWHGGPSSVMNPLPWDQLPTDSQDTSDYPSLPFDSLSITTTAGEDATKSLVPLLPPLYPNGQSDPKSRQPQPTALNLSVQVPKFQPANVNRGAISFTDGGASYNFGSSYLDISGTTRGANNSDPLLTGPLVSGAASLAGGGQPWGLGRTGSYPAGGYIGDFDIDAVPVGSASGRFTVPYRTVEMGLTVPPDEKLSVQEETLDLGKLPMAEGYSDTDYTGTKFYRVPFAPAGTRDYLNPLPVDPWDPGSGDPSQTFFHPFTLENDGNINAFDLRVAKLTGPVGAGLDATTVSLTPGANKAASAILGSDQVDDLAITPLIADPFGGIGELYGQGFSWGLGNIGLVSSFDHPSTNAPYLSRRGAGNTHVYFNEHPVWPIPDNYVSLPSGWTQLPQVAFEQGPTDLLMSWANGFEPQPTLHKPEVGDAQPTTATVPDVPHNAAYDSLINPFLNTTGTTQVTTTPRLGFAIPIGTPSGSYYNPVYVYDDNTPMQWREWLTQSNPNAPLAGSTDPSHDGILNTGPSGTPIETRADPTMLVKATVRDTRLTGGVTYGSPVQIGSNVETPGGGTINSIGSDVLPAVQRINSVGESNLFVYWSTDRQPIAGVPGPGSPWSLAWSELLSADGDFRFANPGTAAGAQDGELWGTAPYGMTLHPDPTAFPVTTLFPSTAPGTAGNPLNLPALPGTPNPTTVRHTTPAIATLLVVRNSGAIITSTETWLFWQGSVQKTAPDGITQINDSRTFYEPLFGNGVIVGQPSNQISAFLNDPQMPKLGVKPLEFQLSGNNQVPTTRYMYLFWYTGSPGHYTLYYNVNVSRTGSFPVAGWGVLGDQKLPLPGTLAWASDPYPIYRVAWVNGALQHCIDVVYDGVFRNHRKSEVLLSRFVVNRTAIKNGPAAGTLSLVSLPQSREETLSRDGATNTWIARDAGWNMSLADPGSVTIFVMHNGQLMPVNTRSDGNPQIGTFDAASGLVYYASQGRDFTGNPVTGANAFGGGQVVVDPQFGSVSFPNVPPGVNDTVLATYTPTVMRLNASRDDRLVFRDSPSNFSTNWSNDGAFTPRPAQMAPGDNTNPVVVLDRTPNPRAALLDPAVVFNTVGTTVPPVDRLWVLYQKTDNSGVAKNSIYYKAMRLMIKLPRPVLLTPPDANGNQQISGPITITPDATLGHAIGPYEIDWVRGRIYFTEADEGNVIHVNYPYARNGGQVVTTGDLEYTVGWEDEISAAGQPSSSGQPFYDLTTPEQPMPTTSSVNEGQVAACLDPFTEKMWVFWSSNRAKSATNSNSPFADRFFQFPPDGQPTGDPALAESNLFYQVLAPQFYPDATNAH